MALTNKRIKEILSKAGVTSENISEAVDEIMLGHNASIDALSEERDKYKKEAEKVASLQKDLDDAKTALANGDKSPYKVKFENLEEEHKKLQEEFDNYKADIASKETLSKKTDAYKSLLKEIGISEKRIDSVLKVSEFDKIEFDDDGKIKDADKLKESLKDEWSDFIVTEHEQGAKTPNPPSGGNGGNNHDASHASQLAAQFYANRYGTNKED